MLIRREKRITLFSSSAFKRRVGRLAQRRRKLSLSLLNSPPARTPKRRTFNVRQKPCHRDRLRRKSWLNQKTFNLQAPAFNVQSQRRQQGTRRQRPQRETLRNRTTSNAKNRTPSAQLQKHPETDHRPI